MRKKQSAKSLPVNQVDNTNRRLPAEAEPYKWKKGHSGNPNGRPKLETPSETLRAMLNAEYGPDAVKQLQKTMPEPWRSKPELTTQEILIWMMLRKAMQSAGDNARKEVFDRIEGRPTLKISGPQGGPIETVTYDLKRLSVEQIRMMRSLLAAAAVGEGQNEHAPR